MWSDSRLKCQTMGSDLAVISSAGENQFIANLIEDRLSDTTVGAWIGLQRKSDSMFYWIDGTPLDGQYTNWGSGEPNNAKGNEDAVYLYSGGQWNDDPCNLNGYPYWENRDVLTLCERPI